MAADMISRYLRIGEERKERKISINIIKPISISNDLLNKIKNMANEQTENKMRQKEELENLT